MLMFLKGFYKYWIILLFFKFYFIFKLYNIVLVLPNIEMNPPQYTCVSHPKPSSLLPPHTIPLGRPIAPAPSIQYCASNLEYWIILKTYLSGLRKLEAFLPILKCIRWKVKTFPHHPHSPRLCSVGRKSIIIYASFLIRCPTVWSAQ